MKFAVRLLAFGALCLVWFAAPASAQYMYMDTNGDGAHTSADALNANGVATTVDVYLNTDTNADDSPATCDTGDGDLTINSWVVNTHAVGGTVAYSDYINESPTIFASANRGFVINDHDMSVGQISANSNAPGHYYLMRMTVTGQTGSPSLELAEYTDNSPDPCSFGSQCTGLFGLNTYEYLVDWFDAGNLPAAVGGNQLPSLSVPANASGTENTPIATITATATDPDLADVLTISQTGKPADLTFSTTPSSGGSATATITGTPGFTDAAASPYTINWQVSDTHDIATGTTTLTIANTDRPPVVNAPANESGTVNTLLTFQVTASDPDGDGISSFTAAGPPGSTFTPDGTKTTGTFNWTPSGTQAGAYDVVFTAQNLLSGTGTTHIDIAGAADQAPTVSAPGTASVDEGALLTVDVTANDPDGDPITSLTASGTAVTAGATFSAGAGNTSGTLSWTPSFTQAGSYAATFTAANALSGSATTDITVNNVDQPPVLAAISDLSVAQGFSNTTAVNASDPDGDVVELSASLPAFATLDAPTSAAGTISTTVTAAPSGTDAVGDYPSSVTATALALTDTKPFTIHVTATDQPPVLDPVPSITVDEGASGSSGVHATDPDGDTIDLTASLPSFAVLQAPTSGAGSVTTNVVANPGFSDAGSYPSSVTATSNTLHVTQDFTITVNNVDQAPTVSAPANVTGSENNLLTVDATASDPDGDAINSFTASGSAITAGATFTANGSNTSGTLSWTPGTGQSGSYDATFTATNDLSGSATTAISIGVDSPPVVTAPATASVDEGSPLAVDVTATDPDGDPITSLTATGTALTAGASFAANGSNTAGSLSWTPSFTQAGSYSATFTASNALSGSATTDITVNNFDRAPTVSAPSTESVAEGANLNFSVTAADPDGDAITSLTAAGSAITAGATFTPDAGNTSGTFDWTPGPSDVGPQDVTFTASNALSGSATTNITVTAGANHDPVVTAPPTESTDENVLLTFGVSATDVDGDHVTLTATGSPSGSSFLDNGDNTGTFSWTPDFTQAGGYTVTFHGSDGNGGTGSAATDITVNDVNRAPTADAGGPYHGVINIAVSFNGAGSSDPDGDALSFAWNFGDGSVGTGATPSHPYAAIGTYDVSLTVTDPGTLTGSDQTTATIVDVFQANVFLVGGNKTTRLGAGKPSTCVQIEPVDGSFELTDVDLSSIVMRYGGAEISAADKTSIDGDRDHNGVQEIAACFTKEDLRTLFAGLPNGSNDVEVEIAGNLVTGGGFSGTVTMHVVAKSGPVAASAAPNPLNPETEISFSVERGGQVRVQIFDLAGRLVNTLSDQTREAGYYSVRWSGSDRNGSRVASGIYYVRVQAPNGSVVLPVTVLK